MNKTLISTLLLSVLVAPIATANTKSLSLSYDGFFDRIEKLDKPEFQNVKLAFYLKEITTGQPCEINSVKLKTKLKSLDVYFYEDGEIILPFDKQFDLDKAQVVIDKRNDDNCGLDMRLESVLLFGEEVTGQQIHSMTNTFDEALKKQTGMMSFLAPDVVGLTFLGKAGTKLQIQAPDVGVCNDLGCTITKIEMTDLSKKVRFNERPNKVVPYIKK